MGSCVRYAWDEVAASTRYIRSLIESMTRRIKSVVEAQEVFLLKRLVYENSPFKG